jgi:DNA modification methylase
MSEPYYTSPSVVLYHGKAEEIMSQLEDASIDHTLTDPPYARDVYQRLTAPNTKNGSGTPARLGIRNHQYSSMSLEKLGAGAIGNIDEILEDVAAQIARLTRRWALVFSDVETTGRWRYALEDAGMRYVRTGAWVKTDPMPQFSGDRPAVGFEPCTITHAKGPMRWNGGGAAAVWTYGTVKVNRPDHECPKPLALMRELVRLFTDPGETILDPFAGSGTTLLAAQIEGRKAIGIEVREKDCAAMVRRLEVGVVAARRPEQSTMAL